MSFKNNEKENTFNPNSWRRKVNLGIYMKGSIRAHCKAVCLKCGNHQFKQVKIDVISQKVPQCENCGGAPNRYILRKVIPGLYGKGVTKDFYTNHAGNHLLDIKECIGLLYKINNELETGVYEAEDYIAGIKEDYKFKIIGKEYLRYLGSRALLPEGHDNSLAPSSLRASTGHLKHLVHFFGEMDIRKIGKRQIQDYYYSWIDRFRTRDLTTSELRTILRWVKREYEILKTVPDFPKIKKARELREEEIPSIEEQLKIILNIKNEVYQAAYILGSILAKRPSEIRAWKVRDVDLNKRSITTRSHFSKGGKGVGEVLVSGRKSIKEIEELGSIVDPIDDYLIDLLRPFLNNKGKDEFLFLNQFGKFLKQSCFREQWVRSAKELGLGRFKSYSGLKHCTLSHLVEVTGDLALTKKFSGHTNLKMLERYAKNKGNKKSEIIGQSTARYKEATLINDEGSALVGSHLKLL